MDLIPDLRGFYLKHRNKILSTYHEIITPKSEREVFYDACFCLMVPGGKYHRTLKGLKVLKAAALFHNRDLDGISQVKLRDLGWGWEVFKSNVRFPLQKYQRIKRFVEETWEEIKDQALYEVPYCEYPTADHLREILVKKVSGMGYKAASHFLRNQGAQGLAIIDTHILKYQDRIQNTIPESKPIKKINNYKKQENVIRRWCTALKIPPHILDLIIWTHHSEEYNATH